MPYATTRDLITRFGEFEIQNLASIDGDEVLDNDKIASALSDAEAEINSYLGQRYQLPLSSVPEVVKGACCDIARYNLYANQTTDEVQARYNKRISWLRDVASNRASLGLAEKTQSSAFSVAVSNGGGRIFTRDTLKGY
jgi:phage gp36-like protein